MKKIMKKLTVIILSFVVACSFALAGCKKNNKASIEIVVDGGGAFTSYNSSISMVPSAANPYPYNTLEVLAGEYMELHPDVKIKIRSSSYEGSRESLIPLLSQRQAPDIIYQNGTVANDDMGKNYYVMLNEYFEKPNPYVEGNTHWKDIYPTAEFEATRCIDKNFYFACIDRCINGMIYNKTLFARAGVTEEPETFAEFMAALAKLNEIGVIPYLSGINNYDLFIEGNLFSSYLDEVDVLYKNGIVDAEELVRAITKGIFSAEEPIYEDFITMLDEKAKYYPNGYEGYDVFKNFIDGKVAVIECNGPLMMQCYRANIDFEIGYFAFPYVSTEDEMPLGNPNAGKPLCGGSAGLSSAWWVTNTAVSKGQKAVDAAVDFLMYVTAPQNNNRMVNDLGAAVPISLDADCAPYFKKAMSTYAADVAAEKNDWHVFGTYGSLGNDYYIFFTTETKKLYSKTTTISKVMENIIPYLNITAQTLALEKGWDTSRW